MTTKKLNLINDTCHFSDSDKSVALILEITTPANPEELIVVLGGENISKKIEYIVETYDENLVHKYNNKVFVKSYTIKRVECSTLTDLIDSIN